MDRLSDAPLAPLTTLGLGGPARTLLVARDADDLVQAVREHPGVLLLAGGSNTVLPDAGVELGLQVASRGVQIRDGGRGEALVDVAAGHDWDDVVAQTLAEGLAGLEALSGIPGSTGATPVQNVGAYGAEVADTVRSVQAVDRDTGELVALAPPDCGFGYRDSVLKQTGRYVVLSVTFGLARSSSSAPVRYAELARALGVEVGQAAPVGAVRETVLALRAGKGMVLDADDPDTRSAGSFFTNPILTPAQYEALADRADAAPPRFPASDGRVKTSAAWLVEQAGFAKGHGGEHVRISSKHTLALTHPGGGTTAELLALAREIRGGVEQRFGVRLVAEPVIVGDQL